MNDNGIDTNFDGVKWMIYRSHRTDNWITVCVQWFDMHDYVHDRFYDNTLYDSEEDADMIVKELNKKKPIEGWVDIYNWYEGWAWVLKKNKDSDPGDSSDHAYYSLENEMFANFKGKKVRITVEEIED